MELKNNVNDVTSRSASALYKLLICQEASLMEYKMTEIIYKIYHMSTCKIFLSPLEYVNDLHNQSQCDDPMTFSG